MLVEPLIKSRVYFYVNHVNMMICKSAASGVASGMFNVSKKYVRFVKIVLLFKLKFKILHCSL